MFDPPAPVAGETPVQSLERGDDLRIGGIADGVDGELKAIGGRLFGLLGEFDIADQAQPARVRLIVVRRLESRPA